MNVPAPRDPGGKPKDNLVRVKSKGIKIPHTLNVTDQEIMKSYDGGDDVPEGTAPRTPFLPQTDE